MAYEATGKLYKKFDTAQVTASFKKREFVLEVESGQYPQLIKFQLVQDKCEALEPYNEGDTLNVHFDLRGREWTNSQGNTNYFTNLQAWKIENQGAAQTPPPAGPPSTNDFPTLSDAPTSNLASNNDDLPF